MSVSMNCYFGVDSIEFRSDDDNPDTKAAAIVVARFMLPELAGLVMQYATSQSMSTEPCLDQQPALLSFSGPSLCSVILREIAESKNIARSAGYHLATDSWFLVVECQRLNHHRLWRVRRTISPSETRMQCAASNLAQSAPFELLVASDSLVICVQGSASDNIACRCVSDMDKDLWRLESERPRDKAQASMRWVRYDSTQNQLIILNATLRSSWVERLDASTGSVVGFNSIHLWRCAVTSMHYDSFRGQILVQSEAGLSIYSSDAQFLRLVPRAPPILLVDQLGGDYYVVADDKSHIRRLVPIE